MAGDDDATTKPPPPPPAPMNHTHPFYVGSQDRPGDFITPLRLRLDNYDQWANGIRLALNARRKFGFLDGRITSLVPPATQDDWVTVHALLVSWITNTITGKVLELLSDYDNAKKLWDDLKERFSVTNGPRIHHLKAALHDCTQDAITPISVYFGKLNVLWDELGRHEPLISCKCGKCDCDVGPQHSARRDQDRLHQFLFGLYKDHYGPLRSNLISLETVPTLNRAYQLATQDEQTRAIDAAKDVVTPVNVASFATRVVQPRSEDHRTKSVDRSRKKSDLCPECGTPGHDESTCFEIHGVGDWYVEKYGPWKGPRKAVSSSVKPRTAAASTSAATGRGRAPVRAHNTTTTTQVAPSSTTTVAPTYTVEQWRHMATMFGSTPSSSSSYYGPTDEDGDWDG